MNHTKLPKKVLLLLATPVLFSVAVPAVKLAAQSQTETKIRLMAEGLRARDSGDLATAKANFEQLLVLAPNDVTVQRLLADVNNRAAAPVAVEAAPVAVESASVQSATYDPAKPADLSQPAVVAAPAPAAETAAPAAEAAAEVAPVSDQATELAKAEEARIQGLLADAKVANKDAAKLAKSGDYAGATAKLDSSLASLPVNTLTEPSISELQATKNDLLLRRSQQLLAEGDTKGAQEALNAYIAATSPDNKAAAKQAAKIDKAELNPGYQPIDAVSPNFIQEQKDVAALLSKGRSQYNAGDLDGAKVTFQRVEVLSPDNAEAKSVLKRIADDQTKTGVLNREKTRSTMLQEVGNTWQRPGIFAERDTSTRVTSESTVTALTQKLNNIVIPVVRFDGVPLDQVINTLGVLSEEFDTAAAGPKGVNLVLGGQLPGAQMPLVSIRLSGMSLKRILDIVTGGANHEYIVESDIVTVRPTGGIGPLVTEPLSITKNAIARITGTVAGATATTPAVSDPFAEAAPSAAPSSGGGDQNQKIRQFLQGAGVDFDKVPNSSVFYDQTALVVTQTPRNIEKIRQLIGRYNEIARQVEIESKFMDVAEGTLNEFGIQWAATSAGGSWSFGSTGVNRQLSSISGGSTLPIGTAGGNSLTSIPGAIDLGSAAGSVGLMVGKTVGEFSVDAQLRALAQKTGSDLLSAPKATVLSGSQAELKVVQELSYPTSYSDAEIQPATVSNGTVIPGTFDPSLPEEFATRDVGVTLRVLPEVEDDLYTINLTLDPEVVEFEGFVNYGTSITQGAGGNTQTFPLPSLQPVFSVRKVTTKVTVWDGATVVMGGLTREEVRRVDDKIPVLGDIPFLGRAFKSKGEASQKRNLLIFVTANLVSPGGSLRSQSLRGVEPGSVFQNPSVVTPGGAESRLRGNQ